MIAWIGIAGVVGACARFYLGKWISSKVKASFPIATLMINVSGSLVLGMLYALHTQGNIPNEVWFMLGAGFCGAYTTFSTFGYETLQLVKKKKFLLAVAYIFLSVLLSVACCWIGIRFII
ncbi:fluoride efflux transporter CrcB [Bacillus horti]|uniref:Fluoride-specific ion channel FluC n=1 Tax=Caldalkalibacillus horti TaxID=77523 RepID=A0ABT9VVD3_9BACI|nr:fluoride efflux transporter CrcB [Bacillus horti]MDQ0164943.1 CrcB protein [Bacillus horti]